MEIVIYARMYTWSIGIRTLLFKKYERILPYILLITKNVYFVKLSKCVTDFIIAFLSMRWSNNIYGTSNLGSGWESYAFEKMFHRRDFRLKLELPAHTRAGTFGSNLNFRPASKPELPTQAWTSGPRPSRNFRLKLELAAHIRAKTPGSSLNLWPAPEPELSAQAWTSGPHPSRNSRLKLELPTRTRAGTLGSSLNFRPAPEPELPKNLIKRVVRVWPFGFRSKLFQTRGKLRK
jgi:hypothetical protein